MRASFIFTHKPGRRFHFMDYIIASMDDDCAKVTYAAVPCCLDKQDLQQQQDGSLVFPRLTFSTLAQCWCQ